MRARIEKLKDKCRVFVSTNPRETLIIAILLIIAFCTMVMIGSTSCSATHHLDLQNDSVKVIYKDSVIINYPLDYGKIFRRS